MATINNSELSREIIDGAKIAIGREKVPDQISEKVVAVMECNPKLLRRVNLVRGSSSVTTGTITLFTTPTDTDFYISELNMAFIKDVTCDAATGAVTISVVIDGVTRNIAGLSTITLTAQSGNLVISFPLPVKLDRTTSITMNGTYTAGVMSRYCSIAGYIVQNANV